MSTTRGWIVLYKSLTPLAAGGALLQLTREELEDKVFLLPWICRDATQFACKIWGGWSCLKLEDLSTGICSTVWVSGFSQLKAWHFSLPSVYVKYSRLWLWEQGLSRFCLLICNNKARALSCGRADWKGTWSGIFDIMGQFSELVSLLANKIAEQQ